MYIATVPNRNSPPAILLREVVASPHHGHVQAVLRALQRLDFAKLIASRPSRERVVAMVVARLLEPDSKRATTRWLLERQARIEKQLAARHLDNDAMALYDLSSSYVEGTTCPLAAFGHNRDGKKGKRQINYGLLARASFCACSPTTCNGT